MTYKNLQGQPITLGQPLGKGAAATVYLHGSDPGKAVKIFNPQHLAKEKSLAQRLQKLHDISRHLHMHIEFKGPGHTLLHPIGSLPMEIVKDTRGLVVGFVMPTVKDGIDMSHVIFARDQNAFYKIKDKPYYSLWYQNFVYGPKTLRNRFILCYYLATCFSRLYNLKTKQGQAIDLQLYNFDIKPANILVSLQQTGNEMHIMPFILDLDNLTLKNDTGILAPESPQFTLEYKAPEGPQDHYYDYFSIAVIFYQLIFNIHPFEGLQGKTRYTDGTNRDFFMTNQCFPWGKNGKFLHIADKHENFQRLPEYLKSLFKEALDAPQRHLRPDMHRWQKGFLTLLSDTSLKFESYFKFH